MAVLVTLEVPVDWVVAQVVTAGQLQQVATAHQADPEASAQLFR